MKRALTKNSAKLFNKSKLLFMKYLCPYSRFQRKKNEKK